MVMVVVPVAPGNNHHPGLGPETPVSVMMMVMVMVLNEELCQLYVWLRAIRCPIERF